MLKWTEILSSDELKLREISSALNVNSLALEDCLHRDQRPKLDDYNTHQLLVWFLLVEGQVYELQFLIFPNQLIVVPHEKPPSGETWRDFLKISENHKDVWHMLYQALDKATDITWTEMRALFSKLDEFEQNMFKKEVNPQKMLHFKKHLNQIDLSIGHLSSVASQIQNLCKPTDDLVWKLRDLFDHCERIYRYVSMYRSQIASTIELYWGLQAHRSNTQIKKLTLIASVSVPLTFWCSFWGMNFEYIPFSRPELFYLALVLMVLSVIVTAFFLIRKGYWSD